MQIRVERLSVTYGDRTVLREVSFEVRRGEFLSIIGKSGCGKSTLLNALLGFIERQGDVHMPPHAGVVFQNYAIFPWLTVRKNIEFGLRGVEGRQRAALVNGLLEMTGLSEHADKYPAQLSGGQSQRVALARALAPDPEVVLMDEPFGALDLYTRERMQTWLLDVWGKSRKTVLFVTHSIEEAIFLSDRVIVLGGGRVRGDIPIPFTRPRNEDVKFTLDFGELSREIRDLMGNA